MKNAFYFFLNKKLSDFFTVLFATHLYVFILTSFLVFFCIGLVLILLFHYFLSSIIFDSTIFNALGDLSLIIGFIYAAFVQKQTEGYTKNFRLYLRFLLNIKDSARYMIGLYLAQSFDKQEKMKKHLMELQACYQFLCFYTFQIFADWNKDSLGTLTESRKLSFTKAVTHGAAEEYKTSPQISQIAYLPKRLGEIQDEFKDSGDVTKLLRDVQIQIMKELTELYQLGINDVLIEKASRSEETIWDSLNDIE